MAITGESMEAEPIVTAMLWNRVGTIYTDLYRTGIKYTQQTREGALAYLSLVGTELSATKLFRDRAEQLGADALAADSAVQEFNERATAFDGLDVPRIEEAIAEERTRLYERVVLPDSPLALTLGAMGIRTYTSLSAFLRSARQEDAAPEGRPSLKLPVLVDAQHRNVVAVRTGVGAQYLPSAGPAGLRRVLPEGQSVRLDEARRRVIVKMLQQLTAEQQDDPPIITAKGMNDILGSTLQDSGDHNNFRTTVRGVLKKHFVVDGYPIIEEVMSPNGRLDHFYLSSLFRVILSGQQSEPVHAR